MRRVSLDHVWLLDNPRVDMAGADDPAVDDPVTGQGSVFDSSIQAALPSISQSQEGNASQVQGQAAGVVCCDYCLPTCLKVL